MTQLSTKFTTTHYFNDSKDFPKQIQVILKCKQSTNRIWVESFEFHHIDEAHLFMIMQKSLPYRYWWSSWRSRVWQQWFGIRLNLIVEPVTFIFYKLAVQILYLIVLKTDMHFVKIAVALWTSIGGCSIKCFSAKIGSFTSKNVQSRNLIPTVSHNNLTS